MDFDYFYNREAERFNFLKVPEILVDGEEFRGLSAEASLIIAKNFVKDYEKMKKENMICTPKIRQKKSNFWGILL